MRRGSPRKDRVAIARQVKSAEFRKLSSEELELYRVEAEQMTARNKQFAETPVKPEMLFRNQQKFKEVLTAIFSAFLGTGRACIGKGVFHIQYTLCGEGGPFSRSLVVGPCQTHYTQSKEYEKVMESWVNWSIEELRKDEEDCPHFNSSTPAPNSELAGCSTDTLVSAPVTPPQGILNASEGETTQDTTNTSAKAVCSTLGNDEETNSTCESTIEQADLQLLPIAAEIVQSVASQAVHNIEEERTSKQSIVNEPTTGKLSCVLPKKRGRPRKSDVPLVKATSAGPSSCRSKRVRKPNKNHAASYDNVVRREEEERLKRRRRA